MRTAIFPLQVAPPLYFLDDLIRIRMTVQGDGIAMRS